MMMVCCAVISAILEKDCLISSRSSIRPQFERWHFRSLCFLKSCFISSVVGLLLSSFSSPSHNFRDFENVAQLISRCLTMIDIVQWKKRKKTNGWIDKGSFARRPFHSPSVIFSPKYPEVHVVASILPFGESVLFLHSRLVPEIDNNGNVLQSIAMASQIFQKWKFACYSFLFTLPKGKSIKTKRKEKRYWWNSESELLQSLQFHLAAIILCYLVNNNNNDQSMTLAEQMGSRSMTSLFHSRASSSPLLPGLTLCSPLFCIEV